jgi:prepilin-type processing-associated H-X9-DG protein
MMTEKAASFASGTESISGTALDTGDSAAELATNPVCCNNYVQIMRGRHGGKMSNANNMTGVNVAITEAMGPYMYANSLYLDGHVQLDMVSTLYGVTKQSGPPWAPWFNGPTGTSN